MTSLPYYFRESYGIGTNLQLYSLRQAWRCWQDLTLNKDQLNESKLRERCVVIIDLLGLSLSQLLGQNVPLTSTKIPPPRKLLPTFLDQTTLSKTRRDNLISRFQDFFGLYDDCRHFGTPKHKKLDTLDFAATKSFVDLTIEIWDVVIAHFKAGSENEVEFNSIREILDESNHDEEQVNA